VIPVNRKFTRKGEKRVKRVQRRGRTNWVGSHVKSAVGTVKRSLKTKKRRKSGNEGEGDTRS